MTPLLLLVYMCDVAIGLVPISVVVAFAGSLIRRNWDRAGEATWESRMLEIQAKAKQ